MSSTGSTGGRSEESASHAYFRAVEDVFIRLRGAPFLLSPEDWRVAQGWHRAGIPLSLVERVLERILGRREEEEGEGPRRIRSLRYFDGAVKAAWGNVRSLAGSEEEREAEPLPVEERLAKLAQAIPAHLPEAELLSDRVRQTRGTAEEVEARLEVLDAEMLRAALDGMDGSTRRELEKKVEEGLRGVAGRLDREALEEARQRLTRQTARRLLALPILSLFSADARSDPESGTPVAPSD